MQHFIIFLYHYWLWKCPTCAEIVDFMAQTKARKTWLTKKLTNNNWGNFFLEWQWNGINTNHSKVFDCVKPTQRLWERGPCQRPMMSLFDATDCFVRIGESLQPAGVPFTPRKQLGPDPCNAGPQSRGSFQAGRPREPPRSHPPATSHSAPEITLFILCIIVSSWMRKTMATLEWIGLACVPAC